MNWIPVKDRLPEIGQGVLLAYKNDGLIEGGIHRLEPYKRYVREVGEATGRMEPCLTWQADVYGEGDNGRLWLDNAAYWLPVEELEKTIPE